MIMADLATSHVQKKDGNWVVTDADGSKEILTGDQYHEKRKPKHEPVPPGLAQKPKLKVH